MTHAARLLVAALLLAGCGGGAPPARGDHTASVSVSPSAPPDAVPAPRVVTPADDGARFTMAVGATSTLRVQDPAAADPTVTGTAVLVVPVANVAGTGVREFELRAVEPGTSTVTGTAPDYALTLVVR